MLRIVDGLGRGICCNKCKEPIELTFGDNYSGCRKCGYTYIPSNKSNTMFEAILLAIIYVAIGLAISYALTHK